MSNPRKKVVSIIRIIGKVPYLCGVLIKDIIMDEKLLAFISENKLSLSLVEKGMFLSRGTLKLSKGKLPIKHLKAVEMFLRDSYGYSDNVEGEAVELSLIHI